MRKLINFFYYNIYNMAEKSYINISQKHKDMIRTVLMMLCFVLVVFEIYTIKSNIQTNLEQVYLEHKLNYPELDFDINLAMTTDMKNDLSLINIMLVLFLGGLLYGKFGQP